MERISAKEVAEIMGFTTTNLKNYASLLELNGLNIFRNTKNHREYAEKDIQILQAMQYLNREKSMPLDEAASFVMSSDTSITDILAKMKDSNIRVLKQDNDSALKILEEGTDSALAVLSVLSTILKEQKTVREEMFKQNSDQLEMLKEISGALTQQSATIQEQNETIEALQAEFTRYKEEQNNNKKGFWARILG